MPFLHAFLGCDITSCLFGIGKGFIIKKFRENRSLQQAAIVFDNRNATQAQIDHAGEAAFVVMCNGKKIRYLSIVTKLPQALHKWTLKFCLPPQLLSSFIAGKSFFKQINGNIPNVICLRRSGDGSAKILDCILY